MLSNGHVAQQSLSGFILTAMSTLPILPTGQQRWLASTEEGGGRRGRDKRTRKAERGLLPRAKWCCHVSQGLPKSKPGYIKKDPFFLEFGDRDVQQAGIVSLLISGSGVGIGDGLNSRLNITSTSELQDYCIWDPAKYAVLDTTPSPANPTFL